MYVVYGKPSCSFCERAKALLDAKKTTYEYIDVSQDEKALEFLKNQGHRSVPQIYIRSERDSRDGVMGHVGGFTELAALLKSE